MIQYLKILDTFVEEIEENQEKINLLVDIISISTEELESLEKTFKKLMTSTDLNVVDELSLQFKFKMKKLINEFHKALIKAQ